MVSISSYSERVIIRNGLNRHQTPSVCLQKWACTLFHLDLIYPPEGTNSSYNSVRCPPRAHVCILILGPQAGGIASVSYRTLWTGSLAGEEGSGGPPWQLQVSLISNLIFHSWSAKTRRSQAKSSPMQHLEPQPRHHASLQWQTVSHNPWASSAMRKVTNTGTV